MLKLTTHTIRLDELATERRGIVTRLGLDAHGFSESEIRTMVAKGALIRLRRGVYAVGHRAFEDQARRLSKVVCSGEGAALTGISAAATWGITRRHDALVDVVVPRPRRPVHGARVVVDARLPPAARTEHHGIPILTPSWTIASLAPRMGAGELARVLREASYHRILSLAEVVQIAERGDRRPGVATLRRAIDLRTAGSAGYASRFERDVNRAIRGLPIVQPLPNVLIAVAGDALEVDLVWRDAMICGEIDGPIHDDPDVQREDARRTALLEAAGWTVIRIHWADWEADPVAALEPLIAAVMNARPLIST